MRGPAKCFFHRPCWEIFAMVSIQIWVTRFHIQCTGELEQVCLAVVIGSPFFSTGLGKQHHIELVTRDAFVHSFPRRNDTAPAACCQCHPGLPKQPPGATRPAVSQPNAGRRRGSLLRSIANSVSLPCCCSTQMKTTSFTLSVLWLSRL